MFERVETARAYSRAALAYTQANLPGAVPEALGAIPRHARAAQVFAKRMAYDVAHDALQVFGAQGLSKDSLIEKLFRDARSLSDRGRHLGGARHRRGPRPDRELRAPDLRPRGDDGDMVTSKSTPLDSPLYQMDPDRGIEYWGCKAVMATFTVGGDIADLVPRSAPGHARVRRGADRRLRRQHHRPLRRVRVAVAGRRRRRGRRDVHPLHLRHERRCAHRGPRGAGRTEEACIGRGRRDLPGRGRLAGPTRRVPARGARRGAGRAARRRPARRAPAAGHAVLLAAPPAGPPGATQVHELIRWNCDLAVRADAFGDPLRFTGPASINYPTRSAIDPVHRLAVDTFLGGAYLEFDMRLTADSVVWSETVAAVPEARPEPVAASV